MVGIRVGERVAAVKDVGPWYGYWKSFRAIDLNAQKFWTSTYYRPEVQNACVTDIWV